MSGTDAAHATTRLRFAACGRDDVGGARVLQAPPSQQGRRPVRPPQVQVPQGHEGALFALRVWCLLVLVFWCGLSCVGCGLWVVGCGLLFGVLCLWSICGVCRWSVECLSCVCAVSRLCVCGATSPRRTTPPNRVTALQCAMQQRNKKQRKAFLCVCACVPCFTETANELEIADSSEGSRSSEERGSSPS
eukprot:2087299-Rhodomonas_salina.1